MTTAQQCFPVGLFAKWQAEPVLTLPQQLNDWLFDPGSLTARLKSCCRHFEVKLLGQAVQPCDPAEATPYIKAGEQVLVREVLLYCDDKPQVFARSLLPLASLTGEEQQLADLGTQPLGQVLFNHPHLQRTVIEIAAFDDSSSVGQLCQQLALPFTEQLWGRRSLFLLKDKPLMVAEVFLPKAHAYQGGVSL